jgi:uncharacterized protein YfkK (UPF0435 family)
LSNLTDRDLLIMNTEDTKNLLFSVNRIDEHLKTLNGKVADTMVKLAKTEELTKAALLKAECAEVEAKEAAKIAEECDRATNGRINGMVWAVLGLSVTTLVGFIIALIEFLVQKGMKV